MKKKFYNKAYFVKRDLLSLHLADSIRLFMEQNNLHRTLDVGCGTGKLVHYLRRQGYCSYGCDIEEAALEFARKINSPQIIRKAAVTYLPFVNSSFDLVTSIHVIEHLSKNEVIKFLSEARRILKHNGFIFTVAPNFSSPLRYFQGRKWFGYEDPTHIRFDTPDSISKLLKFQGFTRIQFTFRSSSFDSGEIEALPILNQFPKFVKIGMNFLLFSTPLTFLRNGFWVAAQK